MHLKMYTWRLFHISWIEQSELLDYRHCSDVYSAVCHSGNLTSVITRPIERGCIGEVSYPRPCNVRGPHHHSKIWSTPKGAIFKRKIQNIFPRGARANVSLGPLWLSFGLVIMRI